MATTKIVIVVLHVSIYIMLHPPFWRQQRVAKFHAYLQDPARTDRRLLYRLPSHLLLMVMINPGPILASAAYLDYHRSWNRQGAEEGVVKHKN